MEMDNIAELYLVVCETYERKPSELGLKGWQLVLAPFDGDAVTAAVAEALRQDRPFAPKPGEIAEMVRRLNGDVPPSIEAAVGMYVAGDTDHPLIQAAMQSLGRMRLDPRCPDPEIAKSARFEFRSAYAAELARHEDDKLRDSREALEAGSVGADMAALLAGE